MSAKWIYTEKPEYTSLYIFKKEFMANGEDLNFRVSACSRYRLYINGKYICEGPCKTDGLHRCYEEDTVKLNSGKNEILAEVLYGTDEATMTAIFFGNEPAFYFSGIYGDNEICSDADFLVAKDTNRSFTISHYVGGTHPSEIWTPNANELEFKNAEVLYDPTEIYLAIHDKYKLKKRPIPQMYLGEPRQFEVLKSDVEAVNSLSGFKTNRDFFIDLKLDKYSTFVPEFTFIANKGAQIKITYSEAYYTKTSMHLADCRKENRLDISGEIIGCEDNIIANGKEITFSPFMFRTALVIRIEATGVKNFEIKNLTYREYHYPLNIVNNFTCSSDEYNKMWDVSLNTLRCCIQETYVDCPYHEQMQYIMDTSLSMLYTFSASDDTAIIKKAIEEFAALKAPDGMLYCSYPGRADCIIPGFSLFFIFMLRNYLLYTGDVAFTSKFIGTVENIIGIFNSKLTDDGVVGNMGYWQFVDWGEGWIDGMPAERGSDLTYYSLLYSNALLWAQDIYNACGRSSEYFEKLRINLNAAINKNCVKNGMYTDTPHGDTFSQHCQVMAILGNVCDDNAVLFEKLLTEKLTECSFCMSYFLLRVYEKCDRYDLADKLYDKWRLMLKNNMSTWGESPAFTRSECHAWGAVMLYEFTACVLGVRPIEIGFKKVEIAPKLGELTFAEGIVPTPYGNINVKIKRNSNGITVKVISSDNIIKVIDGREYTDANLEIDIPVDKF